jgi:hypothetical protein
MWMEEYSPHVLGFENPAPGAGQVPNPFPSAQGEVQFDEQGEFGGTDFSGGQLQAPAGHCSEKPQSVLLAHR